MYQQLLDLFGQPALYIKRIADGACIPFDQQNTDYQRFKQDIASGAELQDAEGNVMTAEQVAGFTGTLP